MPKIPNTKELPAWISENLPIELVNSTLFKFNITLQAIERIDEETGRPVRKKIEVDLLPDVNLDYEDLEQQMVTLPAQYAFWAAVYSESRLGVAVAERKLKARRSEVTKIIMREAAEEKTKLTADIIKTLVESDPRLNEAEMAFQLAQMQTGKLYHMVEALKMKSELARSLLGLKKQERDHS